MPVSSPISPVVDHLADLALWEAELAADPQLVASSLMVWLAQVPDPRDPRGRRHPLVVILVLTACATLVAGNDCLAAIWQWAAGAGQDVLARIGARYDGWTGRYVVPSEATFRKVLARLDGDALDGAVSGYVTDVLGATAAAPVLPVTAGPVEREQRRAASRDVTHPVPDGLLPAAAADGKLLHGHGHRRRAHVPGRRDRPRHRHSDRTAAGRGQTRREHRPATTVVRPEPRHGVHPRCPAHEQEDRPVDHRAAEQPLHSDPESQSAACVGVRPEVHRQVRPQVHTVATRSALLHASTHVRGAATSRSLPRRFPSSPLRGCGAGRLAADDSAWLQPCAQAPPRSRPGARRVPVQAAPARSGATLDRAIQVVDQLFEERARQALHALRLCR